MWSPPLLSRLTSFKAGIGGIEIGQRFEQKFFFVVTEGTYACAAGITSRDFLQLLESLVSKSSILAKSKKTGLKRPSEPACSSDFFSLSDAATAERAHGSPLIQAFQAGEVRDARTWPFLRERKGKL